MKLAIVVGTPLTTEWIWERNQAVKDKRELDELPYDETDTTYFYIVRAELSLKFETIYRIKRYVCNPISLLIIIHRDADTIVVALRLDIAPRSPTSRTKILKAARSS